MCVFRCFNKTANLLLKSRVTQDFCTALYFYSPFLYLSSSPVEF